MKKEIALIIAMFVSALVFAQKSFRDIPDSEKQNEVLLTQYIHSKGSNIIVFSPSNIKQFWIDKSIASQNTAFEIQLTEENNSICRSIPLKIQLVNVNKTQDCTIEVIAESKDYSFNVLNHQFQEISSSTNDSSFINYHLGSSTFHMEDVQNNTFYIVFNSKGHNSLFIKRIILSFFDNKESSFILSPKKILIGMEQLSLTDNTNRVKPVMEKQTKTGEDNVISITGEKSVILLNKKIIVDNTKLSSYVKIKNIGQESARIYCGYALYTENNIKIEKKNYPHSTSNEILTILSAPSGSNTIIVDNYAKWSKDCFLALNVGEDMSDIPNTLLAEGTIVDIRKTDDGHAEITLSKPLKTEIAKGKKVRIHGQSSPYLYTEIKTLNPGEEHIFSSNIKKNPDLKVYSQTEFSRDIYYVKPVILSYSLNQGETNTIQICNYSLSLE